MQTHLSRRDYLCALVLTSLLVVLSSPAFAATWWAAPNGSSTNNGTQMSPWDIKSALLAHNGQVQAGDTIYLMDGNYYYTPDAGSPGNELWVKLMGTATQRITVCPAPGRIPASRAALTSAKKRTTAPATC